MFTNDDGFDSPGLWAAVDVFLDVGDCLIVAPREQQSSMGRSMPNTSEGRIYQREVTRNGRTLTAYAVDGTPAQAVQHGLCELADRKPDLLISGINYGENVGVGITISGTVGAAMEATSLGVPSLAVSQQLPKDLHLSHSNDVDFSAAAHFTAKFGRWLLANGLPEGVDLFKLEVPRDATPQTEWRMTRLSRVRRFLPLPPKRENLDDKGYIDYQNNPDISPAAPDSDLYVLINDGCVAVTPLTLDMTAPVDFDALTAAINGAD